MKTPKYTRMDESFDFYIWTNFDEIETSQNLTYGFKDFAVCFFLFKQTQVYKNSSKEIFDKLDYYFKLSEQNNTTS